VWTDLIQDKAESERDERTVIPRCLLATQSDALESFELADCLLDTGAAFVENFRKEGRYGATASAVPELPTMGPREALALGAVATGLLSAFVYLCGLVVGWIFQGFRRA
jgi:hypothetical protein